MDKRDFKKVFSKNLIKMYFVFFNQYPVIFEEIQKFRKKYTLNQNVEDIFLVNDDGKKYDDYLDKIDREVHIFLKKNHDELIELLEDLALMCTKLKLGKEWKKPLLDYAVTGIISPTPYSVFHEITEHSTITLEINKDTTLSDLIQCWKSIKNVRKKTFGKTRASYPTEKTWEQLKLYMLDINAKTDSACFDHIKNTSYTKKDMDIVGEIYENAEDISAEADKKRKNLLRINRHRLAKRYK
jgi:hypothetical protein